MLDCAGRSDLGRRKTNEDRYACDSEFGCFLVADGMGGHAAGEVASRLALETVGAFLLRSHDSAEFSWPYGIDRTLSFHGNRLRTAVHLANRRVFREAETHDDYLGMGTTIVAAVVLDGQLSLAHVGDSRAYLLRQDTLECLTRDDSWAATVLAQDPAADRALLAAHPMRHVLTNVLGAREQIEIHLLEREVAQGDVLLLCTDGLHTMVPDAEIQAILHRQGELDLAAEDLVQQALAAGGPDNITVVLVRVEVPRQ